jgi:hypothetical protein
MLAVSAAAEFLRCTEAAHLVCTCKAFNDDPGLRDRTTAGSRRAERAQDAAAAAKAAAEAYAAAAGSRENELVQDAAAAYAAVLAANNAVELLIRRPGVRHSLERWREVLAAAPVTPPLLPTNPLLFSALQDLQDAEEAHDAALELYWDAPSESTESYSEEWYGRIGVGPYARWPVRVDAIPSSHGREEDGITTFELAEAYGQL